MYAEVKGVRGRALGARAQGGGDKQEGTASEVVLHWRARAPPFGVAVGSFSFTEIAVGSFSFTEILKSTADVQHNARARAHGPRTPKHGGRYRYGRGHGR